MRRRGTLWHMEDLQAIPDSPWDFEPLEPWGAPVKKSANPLLAGRLRGLLFVRRAARDMADKLGIATAMRTRLAVSALAGAEACAAGALLTVHRARQLPPRPEAKTNSGRALAAVTVTPKLLAQRPFPARQARAGCIALT